MATRKIFSYSVDTGAGSATTNVNLDAFDLSGASALILRGSMSKTDTDAGDTLAITLQSTFDALTWTDRARLGNFTGDMSAAATTPEVLVAVVHQGDAIDSTEEAYEPSGSLGGSAIAAGSVLNGPFPGLLRTALGRQPSWRVNIVWTDADSDGDMEGTIEVYARD